MVIVSVKVIGVVSVGTGVDFAFAGSSAPALSFAFWPPAA